MNKSYVEELKENIINNINKLNNKDLLEFINSFIKEYINKKKQ